MKRIVLALLLASCLSAGHACAQAKAPGGKKAPDSMQVLREQLKGDKKKIVAANMELTEAEARNFWPLYEEHQKALYQVNDRLALVLVAYAREHKSGSITDERALKLLEEYLAFEEAELKATRAMVPKLAKVLPGRKVARYLQIENKIRAIVKHELAAEVPLVR